MFQKIFLQNLLVIGAFFYSFPAMASFYDICEFEAKVLSVSNIDLLNGEVQMEDNQLAAVIKITSAKNIGGHTGCMGYIGNINVLKLKAEDLAKVQVGESISVRYEHWNSRSPTPTGVAGSTTWTLLEEENLVEAPAKIYSAKLENGEIVLKTGVSGGCDGIHKYSLKISTCRETFPVQCDAVLIHKTDDECEAFVEVEARVTLEEAGLTDPYYNGASINIEGGFGSEATIKLPLVQN